MPQCHSAPHPPPGSTLLLTITFLLLYQLQHLNHNKLGLSLQDLPLEVVVQLAQQLLFAHFYMVVAEAVVAGGYKEEGEAWSHR